jgi:hypothetical protein
MAEATRKRAPAKRAAKKTAPSRARKTPTPSEQARARRAPTDHQKPARELASELRSGEYVFEHDGKAYYLPNAQPYAAGIDGGTIMDAVLDGSDEAQGTLAIKIFASAQGDADPDAWRAARAKPFQEFILLVREWLNAAGVDLGK